MGIKAVPTKLFREFLTDLAANINGTKGDHEIWDKKDGSLLRPIVFKTKEKRHSVKTYSLKSHITLEISHQDFEDSIEKLKK